MNQKHTYKNTLEIHHFSGLERGPHVLLLGAVHGDETCGAYALNRLKNKITQAEIKIEKGDVTVIPVSNPIAYHAKSRKINVNLNRIIGLGKHEGQHHPEHDYASQIEQAIQRADIIIDLHSTPMGGIPFVFQDYPTHSGMALAKAVGCKAVVQDWPLMLQNSGITDLADTPLYCQQHKKTSILIECGKNATAAADNVAYMAVMNALVHLDVMCDEAQKNPVQDVSVFQAFYVMRKDKRGDFSKHYNDLDPLKKGEVIINYQDGTTLTCPDDDLYIMIPTPDADIGEEWFYFVKKIP